MKKRVFQIGFLAVLLCTVGVFCLPVTSEAVEGDEENTNAHRDMPTSGPARKKLTPSEVKYVQEYSRRTHVSQRSVELHCKTEMIRAWRQDNNLFYKFEIGREVFSAIARAKGMDKLPDLHTEPLKKLLGLDGGPIPRDVLEIGGGFGRVVEFLRLETEIKNIHAIEIGEAQATFLRDHYEGFGAELRAEQGQTEQNFYIYPENIASNDPFPRGLRFDVALWMFAGLLELSPKEKEAAIANLTKIIRPGGHLVVDMPVGPITSGLRMKNLGNGFLELRHPKSPDRAKLLLHPVGLNNEVDTDALVKMFVGRTKFALEETHSYTSRGESNTAGITPPPDQRRLYIFRRRGMPETLTSDTVGGGNEELFKWSVEINDGADG